MRGLRSSSRPFHDRALTLLEVLVVAAMIALLIAVLLPSLVKAHAQARSTQCLGNLDQQGVAAFMYAYERGGILPSTVSPDRVRIPKEAVEVLEEIPRETARILDKMVSQANVVFYCPANRLRSRKPADFKASTTSPPNSPLDAQILYWWLANPTEQTAAQFLDVDGDQTTTDEYIRKVEARRVSDIAISTDQSRQERPQVQDGHGWFFVHGNQGTRRGSVDTRGLTAWKNNLYGDGHAALLRAPSTIPRWGPDNRAGW